MLLIMEEILIAHLHYRQRDFILLAELLTCAFSYFFCDISLLEQSVNDSPGALKNLQICIKTSKLNLNYNLSVLVYFVKTSLIKNYSPVLMVIQFERIFL